MENQTVRLNQVHYRGLSVNRSAYLDGLWMFSLGEINKFQLSFDYPLELEQSTAEIIFALLGVVHYL